MVSRWSLRAFLVSWMYWVTFCVMMFARMEKTDHIHLIIYGHASTEPWLLETEVLFGEAKVPATSDKGQYNSPDTNIL